MATGSGARNVLYKALQRPAVPHTPARRLATRPHPLANRPSPSGPVPMGRTPSNMKPRQQRWSTLTAILLATLTGTSTYVVGRRSAAPPSLDDPTTGYVEPTRAKFDDAMTELKSWIPDDCLAEDRDSLVAHGHSDWAAHDPKGLPGAVLYPRDTADVVKIVKLASKYGIPLVPYCAGTSLEGHTGALGYVSNPDDQVANDKRSQGLQVLVEDLKPGLAWVVAFAENMNLILEIHAEDHDAVVQPGISYDALNAELKEKGIPLMFPVDPCPGAQIGGMASTCASGTNAVRHGTMRDNVINLTVVLANGEVIKTRARTKKSSAGPDLGKLFIGAEGTLGLITEATVKLVPRLPTSVAVSSFPTIEDAAKAVRDLVQQGVQLNCIELLDDVMIKCINQKGGTAYTWPEQPSLFLKFGGSEEQIKSDIAKTREIAKTNKGYNWTFAKNAQDAEDIWYSRKMGLYAALDYIPGSRCHVTDICVPISKLPEIVAQTKADQEAEGICGPILGHAGDGNIHSLLLFTNEDEHDKVKGLVKRMVARAQAVEGTCTGEHGVGFGKRPYLEKELGKGSVELLKSIKKTMDPQNILNPGKLYPEDHENGFP